MAAVATILQEATRRITKGDVKPLAAEASTARVHVWSRMIDCHEQLEKEMSSLATRPLPETVRTLIDSIRQVLKAIKKPLHDLHACLRKAGSAPTARRTLDKLRIGCGCPGVMGCANISGNILSLSPITDSQVGVLAGMRGLGINIMGLTGARLPPGWTLPVTEKLKTECRWIGGTSYASIAAIWEESLPVKVDKQLGDTSVLWLIVESSTASPMHICFAYLSSSDDDAWLNTLAVLGRDLQAILGRRCADVLGRVVMMGDFNYEPHELGGTGHRPVKRRESWIKFVDKWGLELHNPSMHSDQVTITLPLRDRTVAIKEGTTRHGSATGSAIDLGLSTTDLRVDLLVHNSWHCSQDTPCIWPLCKEFARSDHFPSTMDVHMDDPLSANTGDATPKFPGSWHEQERWRSALERAPTAIQQLSTLVESANDNVIELRRQANDLSRWLVEALALLQSVLVGGLRDAWVQPSNHAPGGSPVNTRIVEPAGTRVCLNAGGKECEHALRQAHQRGAVKTSTYHKCLNWLKPKQTYPQRQMKEGGTLLTEESTHRAWC